MRAYITKYALTWGIEEVEGEVTSDFSDVLVHGAQPYGRTYTHKGDWFTTREEAVTRCEELRKNKIASLERAINKLKGKVFT